MEGMEETGPGPHNWNLKNSVDPFFFCSFTMNSTEISEDKQKKKKKIMNISEFIFHLGPHKS